MRKLLSILAVAALVGAVYGATMSPTETVAGKEMAASSIQNSVLINGVHVALPEYMTNFPKELVPLP
jgi:hypothetical protein